MSEPYFCQISVKIANTFESAIKSYEDAVRLGKSQGPRTNGNLLGQSDQMG